MKSIIATSIILIGAISIFSGCQYIVVSATDPKIFPTNAIAKGDFKCDQGGSPLEIKKGTRFAVTVVPPYKISNETIWGTESYFPKDVLAIPFDLDGNPFPTLDSARMMIIYPNGELATTDHFICVDSRKNCTIVGNGCEILEGGNFEVISR